MASLYGLLLAVGTIRGKDDIHTARGDIDIGLGQLFIYAAKSKTKTCTKQEGTYKRPRHVKPRSNENVTYIRR